MKLKYIYKKIIKLKPELCLKLIITLGIYNVIKLVNFDEAEPNYRKAIEIKPDLRRSSQ